MLGWEEAWRERVVRSGVMAQWLKACVVLGEELGSIPTWQFVCNSNSRGTDTFFWPLWTQACTWCTYIHCRQNTHMPKRNHGQRLRSFCPPKLYVLMCPRSTDIDSASLESFVTLCDWLLFTWSPSRPPVHFTVLYSLGLILVWILRTGKYWSCDTPSVLRGLAPLELSGFLLSY